MRLALLYVLQVVLLWHRTKGQQGCSVGGSTKYCGRVKGAVSGGFSLPCSCHFTLCCSSAGYCGPEPGIANTSPAAEYCTDCQAQYGTCKTPPGPYYFDYIGTGDTYKAYGLTAASPAAPDTLPSTAGNIPVPAVATFFYIIFVVTDTACSSTLDPILGQNTGNFYPKGRYAAGGKCNTAALVPSQIKALQRAPNLKVIVSIAGDSTVTQWVSGSVTVANYVSQATRSLTSMYTTLNLAGFDINYEAGITDAQGNAIADWKQAWCNIIANLKSQLPGVLITFSPFGATETAYRQLQTCLSSTYNTNIDFVIYQTYSAPTPKPTDAAGMTNLLNRIQTVYAPTKVVAGMTNCQFTSNPQGCTQSPISQLVSGSITPALQSGVIVGASVFDADQSLTSVFGPYKLENALWGSSSG